jgi:hypothetical protein
MNLAVKTPQLPKRSGSFSDRSESVPLTNIALIADGKGDTAICRQTAAEMMNLGMSRLRNPPAVLPRRPDQILARLWGAEGRMCGQCDLG